VQRGVSADISCARILLLCVIVAAGTANASQPDKLDGRRAAIDRAMNFVYATAADDENLSKFGNDILWCFYSISHTSRDPHLRTEAARMGRNVAQRWRALHRHVPPDATALDIYAMVQGTYAADRLGLPHPQLKRELSKAAARFTSKDYLGFDAEHEAPRSDDPQRYDVFTDALIRSYFGDVAGIPLGAHYRDVLQWLPRFHPYEGDDDDLQFDSFYTTTHVIYTLNRYHERRISPSLLPKEFEFLRHSLDEAIEDEDPEMVGEALDCLKAAGFENDTLVKKGMEYLISAQRADGAWTGDADDLYTEYHSAWTAIDGLRDYRYHGTVRKLPAK
jgi:hypothetical protein